MSREQLRASALGICLALLLATPSPSPGQSCRDRTSLQQTDSQESPPPQSATNRGEGDEGEATADATDGAEETAPNSQIEEQFPADLEELLTTWEQKCTQIRSLHGTFMRYVYNDAFRTETRANGVFWYRAPDQARIDITAAALPNPPVNPDKRGPGGRPFALEAAENLRWIYTGREVFIIHEDRESFEHARIPKVQQGRGIVLKPFPLPLGMPFPDEMKADAVQQQYHLSLGVQHRPEGRIVEGDGKQIRLRPQLHVVAYPKLARDRADWSRWEVLLDGESFLPHAIRVLDSTLTIETVYVFDLASTKVNDVTLLDPSPFNERPPLEFIRIPIQIP